MDNHIKVNICGVEFIKNLSFDSVLYEIQFLIKNKQSVYFVTSNVDHIVKLHKDAEFRFIYKNAYLVLPDGMPLLWAARFLGTPLREKISGSDIASGICKLASCNGYRLFFLGGKPDSAMQAKAKLDNQLSSIKIVGVYSPPFGFENDKKEEDKISEMIKESLPDILLVGLGAPKQEKWIYKHYKELGVPVTIGIGATFEFISGLVERAPVWMQKAGLEWFWRLMKEPGRLWKRYLIDDMSFFLLVLKQKIIGIKTKNFTHC